MSSAALLHRPCADAAGRIHDSLANAENRGIRLREPVILWLSVQRTNCSESRRRNSAREPKIDETQREKRRRATTTMKKPITITKKQEKLAGRKEIRLSLAAHRDESQGTE
jgi:hypothetical protein